MTCGLKQEAVDRFLPDIERWEGRIPHMYLDHKGYVTCGLGNLIDPVALALELPWLRRDGELARYSEVRLDWERVKAMRPGMRAAAYRAADALHLPNSAIDSLCAAKRDDFWQTLTSYLPTLLAAPASAQLAALEMAWALGPHFPRVGGDWPRFSAAVCANDWHGAAAECEISGGREERNAHHRDLFLAAAALATTAQDAE